MNDEQHISLNIAGDRVTSVGALPKETAAPIDNDGWEWCFLEIMGHRSHWGRSREEERFGSKMIRIDVPTVELVPDPTTAIATLGGVIGPAFTGKVVGWTTHYYGGASIFSFSLTDEATVMKRNKPWAPASRLSLPAPEVDDDAPFDDGGPYNEDGHD